MAPSSSSTFTIQPWTAEPTTTNTTTHLQDVLSRAQRGHLRDITESRLQEELATEGALHLSSSASTSESENDEEGILIAKKKKNTPFGPPSTREDLYNAKRYMLEAISAARNEVSIALDLTSLVISKDLPRQASTTLGAHVKENVPLGTLGVDFWQRMPIDSAREAQDKLLAANVKMDSLQHAADGLLGAAKKMEANVRREARYWDQILSVSEKGWDVCRVPGQQHRLGVRFGFSESEGRFSRKGIAALNDDRERGVRLERGVGSKPRALRAVLRRCGRVVGVSRVPGVRDEGETTLEARIQQARDALFDEELYYEIIRESRTLGSLGVEVEGSAVRLRNVSSDANDEMEVDVDLVSLDNNDDNHLPDVSNESDNLAQATILTARLLLSQAHRDRLRQRSEPPPPLSEKQKDEKPILPILRPILAVMLHHSAIDRTADYFGTVGRTLRAAGLECVVRQPRLHLALSTAGGTGAEDEKHGATGSSTAAETLLTTTLLRPLRSSASLTITSPLPSMTAKDDPDDEPKGSEHQTIEVSLETSLSHSRSFGTVYSLHTPRSQPTTDSPGRESHHFTDFPTLASATSSHLSSALANVLLRTLRGAGHGREWKRVGDYEVEAVLEGRDIRGDGTVTGRSGSGSGDAEGNGEGERVMLVVEMDGLSEGRDEGGELRMTLVGGRERKVFSWSAGKQVNEEGQEGFFEAARKGMALT